MMKPLFRKGSRFPSFHPRRSDRNPVNSSRWVRDVTAYVLKTPAPEKLTSASNVVLTLETISGSVVTTILGKRRPGHSELGIFGKISASKNSRYSGIERNVCVKVPDYVKIK